MPARLRAKLDDTLVRPMRDDTCKDDDIGLVQIPSFSGLTMGSVHSGKGRRRAPGSVHALSKDSWTSMPSVIHSERADQLLEIYITA